MNIIAPFDIDNISSFKDKKCCIIKGKHNFIENIINNACQYKWADIEYQYFLALIDARNSSKKESEVVSLNDIFSTIKNSFIEYLNSLDYNSHNSSLSNIFYHLLDNKNNSDQIIFLNFNYTNSLLKYYEDYKNDSSIREVSIHGKLSDSSSIIFGYGDESSAEYYDLEKENDNKFLDNFKSFHYIKSNSYRELFKSLKENKPWTVHIIGHSCGLCDKILLKEIFDNDDCESIHIYPYKRKDGTLDLVEKIQQISRHFSSNTKHNLRTKISYNPKYLIESNE